MNDELAFPGTDDGRTVAELDAEIKAHNAQAPAPAGYIDQTAVQWIQSHQGGYASASIYPNEVNGTVPFWLEAPAAPVAQSVSHAEWLALPYTQALIEQVRDLSSKVAPAAPVAQGELVTALRPFANIGEYRELREAMAGQLRPHERAGFLVAFKAAVDLVAQIDAAPAAPVARPLVESVINAARAAMDESTEAYDADMSIKIPSHLAASLSLCLDEYDRAHGIVQGGA